MNIKSIKWFFINTWYYRKWLWSSRDFDYHWLLEIIVLWLKRLEHHHNICPTGRKNKDQWDIIETRKLLELIIKDEWTKEEEKTHDVKWGKLWTTYKKVKNKDYSLMNFHRKNIKTKKDKKQEWKERMSIYEIEKQRKKKAIDRCFYLFKKYFQQWWC